MGKKKKKELMYFQKGKVNDQQAHDKMLSIASHQKNASQK